MENEDLQKQIDELKRRMDALNASQTIPLDVDLAFNSRGFVKTDFFVAGYGALNVVGAYDLVIPGATKTSIALAVNLIGQGPIEAEMIPSPTYPDQYQLRVEGGATTTFAFVVFLFPTLYTTN